MAPNSITQNSISEAGYSWISGEQRQAIMPLVVADLHERNEIGKRHYGQELHTRTPIDALWEAYEEAQDYLFYLRLAIEQVDELRAEVGRLRAENERLRLPSEGGEDE